MTQVVVDQWGTSPGMVEVGETRMLQKLRISPTDDPGYEKYKVCKYNTTWY